MRSALRRGLGAALAVLIRAWLWTLRVSLRVAPEVRTGGAPLVLAFWHGQQLGLLRWPGRSRLCVMVSWSRDGELQTGVMTGLGLTVVRGSSSRGGAAGLAALIRRMRSGRDAAFAVDGPRGPLRRAKPGAARAAKLTGAPLVPLACASARALVLGKSWDRFELPLPFSRVAIVAGPPLPPGPDAERRLELAIENARRQAMSALGRDRSQREPEAMASVP